MPLDHDEMFSEVSHTRAGPKKEEGTFCFKMGILKQCWSRENSCTEIRLPRTR